MQQAKATKRRLIDSRTGAAVLVLGFTLTAVLVIATLAVTERMPLVGDTSQSASLWGSVGPQTVDRADHLTSLQAHTTHVRTISSTGLDKADWIAHFRLGSTGDRTSSDATSLDRADRIALMEVPGPPD